MAIYYTKISNVSRAKGSNSLASLSYITGEKIYDDKLGKTFTYGRNERVVFHNTIIPSQAKGEWKNAETLFNDLEKYETQVNARTAKKIIVALPKEFSKAEQIQVLENYIKANITSQNYACTYAIHYDKNNQNPHAHILIANRQINSKGEWGSKRKMEYVLDEKGDRVPQIDKRTGQQKVDKNGRKQWKRINVEVNPLDTKEMLCTLREQWAVECNQLLEPEKHISHKSYKEQGVNKLAQKHAGYIEHNKAKRGEYSEVVSYNQNIKDYNSNLFILQNLEKEQIYLTMQYMETVMNGVEIDGSNRNAGENYSVNSSFGTGENEELQIKSRSRRISQVLRREEEERAESRKITENITAALRREREFKKQQRNVAQISKKSRNSREKNKDFGIGM